MDTVLFFLKGVAAGFVIAAPVGPVGVMCVRRTLVRGLIAGYLIGIGAAVADAVFAIIVALGMGLLSSYLLDNERLFRLGAGVLLCILASRIFLTSPSRSEVRDPENLFKDFFAALVITGTHPVTLIACALLFSAIGVFAAGEATEWARALILGVFVGSVLWWTLLAGITGIWRGAVAHGGMRWINYISAGVVLGAGLLVLHAALVPGGPVARIFNLPFA